MLAPSEVPFKHEHRAVVAGNWVDFMTAAILKKNPTCPSCTTRPWFSLIYNKGDCLRLLPRRRNIRAVKQIRPSRTGQWSEPTWLSLSLPSSVLEFLARGYECLQARTGEALRRMPQVGMWAVGCPAKSLPMIGPDSVETKASTLPQTMRIG